MEYIQAVTKSEKLRIHLDSLYEEYNGISIPASEYLPIFIESAGLLEDYFIKIESIKFLFVLDVQSQDIVNAYLELNNQIKEKISKKLDITLSEIKYELFSNTSNCLSMSRITHLIQTMECQLNVE